MKIFEHQWSDDFFLLHVQANNPTGEVTSIEIIHHMNSGAKIKKKEEVTKDAFSHRFIISRSHPAETSLIINYPEHIILEVYKVDDRAYYPTESFFVL